MKILLIACVFLFAACEHTGPPVETLAPNGISAAYQLDVYKGEIHYIVFGSNYSEGGVFVINATKDSLECEYYKNYLNTK